MARAFDLKTLEQALESAGPTTRKNSKVNTSLTLMRRGRNVFNTVNQTLTNKTLTQEEQEHLTKIRQGLRELFREKGHGAQKEILEGLQSSQAALDIAFKRGNLKFVFLLRILAALEADIGEFFAKIFPTTRPLPPGIPPPGVLSAFKKMQEAQDTADD